MILRTVLVYAFIAATLAWALAWLLSRLGAAAWVVTIPSYATLVYVFWALLTNGPIRVGQ